MIVWRLRETMQRLGVTRYALQKHSGLHMHTVRVMYANAPGRTDFRVVDLVIKTLREMTGADVRLPDVLEWVADEEVEAGPGVAPG